MNKFLYNLKEISIYNTKFVHCDISTCSNQLEKTVRLKSLMKKILIVISFLCFSYANAQNTNITGMLPLQDIYWWAWIYFFSFIIICGITMLNLLMRY